MATQILIAPGYRGSGDDHWQTFWQKENKEYIRIEQRDWYQPVADEWADTIEQYVREASGNVVIVAHSLACIALAFWAQKTKLSIKGALLVAPPNTSDEKLKEVLKGFSPVPMQQLPFKSILLASTNDEYMKIEQSEAFAKHWGSTFVNIGEKGHINGLSNLQNWPEGREYLSRLLF
ncbi:MAG: alpha/beta hydrolase [Bacteroidales bacterium]|nr:alpha/beta hydrolase [Bacteroidales bacterium]